MADSNSSQTMRGLRRSAGSSVASWRAVVPRTLPPGVTTCTGVGFTSDAAGTPPTARAKAWLPSVSTTSKPGWSMCATKAMGGSDDSAPLRRRATTFPKSSRSYGTPARSRTPSAYRAGPLSKKGVAGRSPSPRRISNARSLPSAI